MENIKRKFNELSRSVGAAIVAPSNRQIQFMLLVLGVALLSAGLVSESVAQAPAYNDERIVNAVNKILIYLQGSFGALVMVCAGLGAIVSSAFGQYRAALGLLVVAVGAFILRSLMGTFFNTSNIGDGYGG